MVCIPSADGVLELGWTELIFQITDLMNMVMVLFNFNGVELGGGSWPVTADHGKSDPSNLYLTEPSEIKETVSKTPPSISIPNSKNYHQMSKQILFENPSLSTLSTNPSSIHVNNNNINNHPQTQTQSFFIRELNFSDYRFEESSVRNGNSQHSYKPESGEILNLVRVREVVRIMEMGISLWVIVIPNLGG